MSVMPYNFRLQSSVVVGRGAAATLAERLRAEGVEHPAVIYDTALAPNPAFAALRQSVQEAFARATFHASDAVEPDYDYLDAFRSHFEQTPDTIVGIGGGSTLDLTKAISVLLTNPGPAISYRGFDRVTVPGPAVVLLPTTAGTGSEVTPNAVFTDTREMRKLGINTALYLPKLAILDPLLTLSCPRSATLSSGMDAIVHAIESYAAKASTPISRMFSVQSLGLSFRHLPQVLGQPEDIEAREAMQLAAYYAGVALMNAGSGPAGALSYPLGVRAHVPHGMAGAVFLPRVVAFNAQQGISTYSELCGIVDPGFAGCPTAQSERFAVWLSDFCLRLGVPTTLRGFGVSADMLPVLSQDATRLTGAFAQNPVPFSVADAEELLRQML